MRKPVFGFPTQSDTYQAVQPQKMARGSKFQISMIEGLYYLCIENKGLVTLQLICAFVFSDAKSKFSHEVAHIILFISPLNHRL